MQVPPIEIVGYLASGLIVISLMMRSLLRLRMINLLGAGTMTLYGLAIQSYPVAILNALIVCIDVYYLYEMYGRPDFFTLLEVRRGSRYLKHFLQFYAAEIKKFLPDFRYDEAETQHVFFILRNMVPAGLFITQPGQGAELFVKLDFVIPGYRDLKIGRYVYSQNSQLFSRSGIERIVTEAGTPAHESYLRKMGFVCDKTTARCNLYARMVS